MPYEFTPDWTIAPSGCLADWIESARLTPLTLARRIAQSGVLTEEGALARVNAVLDRQPLTEEDALMLESVQCGTAQFWRTYERHYREGLAAGREDVTPPVPWAVR